MVPAAAGGQAVVSRGAPPAPRDTMPCQPCHGCQIQWGPGHPPVLQCRHRETPGCQLRADRGVQGPAREPVRGATGSGLRCQPKAGPSGAMGGPGHLRPHPGSGPEQGLSTPSPSRGSSYRKAPRPWEKMISGYPLLQGLKGPFQLTGTLQEPAGKRNPPQEKGGHGQWGAGPAAGPHSAPSLPVASTQLPQAQRMGLVASNPTKGVGSRKEWESTQG